MRRTDGFTLVELMVVIAMIATIAAIAIPGSLVALRAANERNAASSLKTLISAEADFAANDRDANRVKDYWTGDVAGLYGMTPVSVAGRTDPMLKLIDISVAAADAVPLAASAGRNNNVASQTLTTRSPKSGYWYYALRSDRSQSPAVTYRANTGGLVSMGNVHHLTSFGFIAFPDRYRSSGRRVFIVNESGSLFACDPGRSIRSGNAVPAGAPIAAWRDWPSQATLKARWRPE